MVSVMDVDMASALLIATHAKADELGVPLDKRVYLRGWCYANDPVLVAGHDEMWRSPAMAAASSEVLRIAGVGADDVAHLDLYSCFPSSLNFGRDALGMSADDPRPLTVTGGLPYHGGPASNYLGHSIGAMADELRADAGSFGMVSGVGMFMTKHVYGLYSTTPGPVAPPDKGVQAAIDAEHPAVPVLPEYDGKATVVAYSVVHGRETAEWALLVCDVDDGDGGARAYAKATDPALLASAEERELVGTTVQCTPATVTLMTGGEGRANLATI
jgi:acetyl-CoA C-acetyltransferase